MTITAFVETRGARCRRLLLGSAAALVLAVPALPGRAATLSNIYAAMPSLSEDSVGKAATFANASGGHTGLLTLELEDDFDAVQVGAINQNTTPWGIARVVLAPSANYGGDGAIGDAAYDLDGNPINQMLPVQFAHGGANSAPSGNPVLSLPLSAAAPAGKTALAFASTTTAAAFGAATPAVGWFAADGTGCIPAGATISAINATRITLSAAVNGCGNGQAIYFSPAAIGPFAQAVPAASAFGEVTMAFSDWIPVASLPRTDGGYAAGAHVSGSGIPFGTMASAVGYTSITLSQALTAALPAQSPISVYASHGPSADTPAGSTTITLGLASGVLPGQTVTLAGAVAPATHVVAVNGLVVGLDKPTIGPIPAGTLVKFINTTYTTQAVAAGATVLPVPSTSHRPLLHLRYFTQASAAPELHTPSCSRNANQDTVPCEAPLGLPPLWSAIGGAQASKLPIDGVDFVSQIGAGGGAAKFQNGYPAFFVRFHGRHAGATLLVCGGFQAAGATGSVSGEASVARIGAAWASAANPAVPISVVGVASRQLNTGPDFDNCTNFTNALSPSLVLIQEYSNHNGALPDPYRAQVQQVAQNALNVGAQPIIYLAYVEAAAHLGGVVVANNVNNSTFVPLMSGVSRTNAGSPTLVTGPGITAGTIAVPTTGLWSLTLSQPATIPAGTILHYALQVSRNIGTFVQLTQPSFLSGGNNPVAGAGIPAGTLVTTTRGSFSATLSQSASIPAGTQLQITNYAAASYNAYSSAALWFNGASDPWDSVRLDGLSVVGTDPNNQYFLCDGCTAEGAFANDYGNGLIAAQFVPLLQQLTGQAQGARTN